MISVQHALFRKVDILIDMAKKRIFQSDLKKRPLPRCPDSLGDMANKLFFEKKEK